MIGFSKKFLPLDQDVHQPTVVRGGRRTFGGNIVETGTRLLLARLHWAGS